MLYRRVESTFWLDGPNELHIEILHISLFDDVVDICFLPNQHPNLNIHDEIRIQRETPEGMQLIFEGRVNGWTINFDSDFTIQATRNRTQADYIANFHISGDSLSWEYDIHQRMIEITAHVQARCWLAEMDSDESIENAKNAEALFKDLFGESEDIIIIPSKAYPGLEYRIPMSGDPVEMRGINGKVFRTYCLDVGGVPARDKIIARVLFLMHDEQEFLNKANELGTPIVRIELP